MPSCDRIIEKALPQELHIRYIDYGWHIYRRSDGPVGTEEGPDGQEHVLSGRWSATMLSPPNLDPSDRPQALPHVVMQWLLEKRCLVLWTLVGRAPMPMQSTLRTRLNAEVPMYSWDDEHGNRRYVGAISKWDGSLWHGHFVGSVDGVFFVELEYSMDWHRWAAPVAPCEQQRSLPRTAMSWLCFRCGQPAMRNCMKEIRN